MQVNAHEYYGQVTRYFDHSYSKYPASSITNPSFDIEVIEKVLCKNIVNRTMLDIGFGNGSILEIGCGRGSDLIYLSKSLDFTTAMGIDISGNAIKNAVELCSANDPSGRIKFRQGNAVNEEIANYSVILMKDVLEYISPDDKKGLIEKMMEHTLPGGINALVFVSSLPKNFWEDRFNLFTGNYDKLKPIFPNAEREKAKNLEFEAALKEIYTKVGWEILHSSTSESERNFVKVASNILIVKKPHDKKDIADAERK